MGTMSYEYLIKITDGRLEEMDEALLMLTPADAGKAFYESIMIAYNDFTNTASMKIFNTISDKLYGLIGYRI